MSDWNQHARRSPRLQGYDYTQAGTYFVTLCTHQREYLFGEIAAGAMRLNAFGEIVMACWLDLPAHYPQVELDAFVVMPNHVHGIIFLMDIPVGEGLRPSPTSPVANTNASPTPTPSFKAYGLPEIVRALKSFSARRINQQRGTPSAPVWQRSYHDHIIRSEKILNDTREYILDNPACWDADAENPANLRR